MFRFTFTARALIVGAIGAVALVPAAQAAPPATDELNPPPPSFLTCKAVGAGTICEGTSHLVKESEEQPELVCGSGADAFTIYDQGDIYQRATRWYDADGNLTRRIIHERWAPAWWSNPLNGETVPYTQNEQVHDGARRAGRLRLRDRDHRGREHLHRPGDGQEGAAQRRPHRVRGRRQPRIPVRAAAVP